MRITSGIWLGLGVFFMRSNEGFGAGSLAQVLPPLLTGRWPQVLIVCTAGTRPVCAETGSL